MLVAGMGQKAIPFALIGSDAVVEVGGRAVRGRSYPWGFVEGTAEQVDA
jgi:septin family protein